MGDRGSLTRAALVAVTLAIALSAAGCGRRLAHVHGTVTLADGTPLSRGLVTFEGVVDGEPVMARGSVKPDGTYELSTYKPGDGIPPGKYRVLINPMDISEVPDERKNLPFDIKYLKYDTSGLEFEVKAGSNEFPIKLDAPNRGRR
jgi:hypothetical protein